MSRIWALWFVYVTSILKLGIFSLLVDYYNCEKNVLFIVSDDLRTSLGCYGDEDAVTPNIDQLCSHSIRFENAFVQQALCGPSRTSFLTSRRPDTTKLYDVHSYWRQFAGNFTTLPQYFKENGYYTVSVGKVFHPGKASNFSDDYPYSWSQYPYHASTEQYKMSKVCLDDDGSLNMNIVCPVDVATQPEKTLPDIQATQFAKEFLVNFASKRKKNEKNVKQPFFLAVGFHKPHIPLKYPREYLDLHPIDGIKVARDAFFSSKLPKVAWNPWADLRERDDIIKLNLSFPFGPMPFYYQRFIRQNYFAATSYMDDLVGKLIKTLQDINLLKETIIVLLGDHGWSLGEHQEWSKYSNFEISTKAPLIIHIPNITEQNKRKPFFKTFKHVSLKNSTNLKNYKNNFTSEGLSSDELVEFVDIFPTLADAVGLSVPKICPRNSSKIDLCTEGISLLPLINSSKREWKSAVFSQFPRPSVFPQENSDQPKRQDIKYMGYSMRTVNYRFTDWVGFDPFKFRANWSDLVGTELYIKKNDYSEDDNVADKYPDLVVNLRKKLRAGWRHALPKNPHFY